jgi:hypothetical protein
MATSGNRLQARDMLLELADVANEVVRAAEATASIEVLEEGGFPVLAITPVTHGACAVKLILDDSREDLTFLFGEDAVPYELVFVGPLAEPEIWEAVRQRTYTVLDAIVRGRYSQERVLLDDASLARVIGTLELPDGQVVHRVWRQKSLFRRKRHQRVSFQHY